MPAMSKILPVTNRWAGRPQPIYKFSIEKQSLCLPWRPTETEEFQHRIACVHHFMARWSNPFRDSCFQRINIPSATTQLNFIRHQFYSHDSPWYTWYMYIYMILGYIYHIIIYISCISCISYIYIMYIIYNIYIIYMIYIYDLHDIHDIYMIYIYIYHVYHVDHIYIYGKCLGFARTRNDDRQRIIIIIIKPLLKIFSECRGLTGAGELNPYRRSSMNVEV